jgi:hypothetical protein|nr:hypothetical protein [uncultured Prevotella sp.]
MEKHLMLLCHGERCLLKQSCERFQQTTAFCPQRAKGDEPIIIDHCDEEERELYLTK